IQQFGGIFFSGNENIHNSGSLEYLISTIQGSVLDFDPHPNITEKAALLAWRIITGHIFIDGNKRTGMETCRLFLEINGYDLLIDHDIVIMALRIAKNEITFLDFVEWLNNRITIHE
ncbi:MAG TPA: type II toxin-antitoxin system death-on-curing family toxin, partial [Anaerolineales bacterium]|nr:type II toxin-antitoxin system death-on-curing family toxin [Anaerolineales bacterium]